jgi:hypothetical protein
MIFLLALVLTGTLVAAVTPAPKATPAPSTEVRK